MTVSKPDTVEVTQAIPGDIWDVVDKIAGPNGNTHREWAQAVDRLRCALAEELHRHRLNATPSRQDGLREALEIIGGLPTGQTEDVMSGHENAYRAIESRLAALSDTPPPDNEETARLRGLLLSLATAEAEYRQVHDLHGDGDMRTGRAWDWMRRKGDEARSALSAFNNGGK